MGFYNDGVRAALSESRTDARRPRDVTNASFALKHLNIVDPNSPDDRDTVAALKGIGFALLAIADAIRTEK